MCQRRARAHSAGRAVPGALTGILEAGLHVPAMALVLREAWMASMSLIHALGSEQAEALLQGAAQTSCVCETAVREVAAEWLLPCVSSGSVMHLHETRLRCAVVLPFGLINKRHPPQHSLHAV